MKSKQERLFKKAERLRSRGHVARALAMYGALLRDTRGCDPELVMEAYLALVACLRTLGRPAAGLKACREAMKHLKGHGLTDSSQDLRLEWALCLRAQGDLGRSIRILLPLARVLKRRRDVPGVAYVLWALGGAYRFMGRFRDSEKAFKGARRLFSRLRDAEGRGYAQAGLGGVMRMRGELKASEACYREALRAFRGGTDRFGLAYAHCGLGNALRQLERSREAGRHYQKARRLYAGIGDELDLGYVEWGLGKVYERTGRLFRAERAYRRARVLFGKGDEKRGEILADMALASVLHARGRSRDAERHFARAYAKARKTRLHSHLESYT